MEEFTKDKTSHVIIYNPPFGYGPFHFAFELDRNVDNTTETKKRRKVVNKKYYKYTRKIK